MTHERLIQKLFHFAYPCRDGEETRHFYEDLLELPLVNCMQADVVPSTGEEKPYAHIFFEMGDGSYIAFFDLGEDQMPLPSPNTPAWVQHLALEVGDISKVLKLRDRLKSANVQVTDIVDHGFIKSIYFFDPNGLRLEITTRTEDPGYLEEAASSARPALDAWTAKKAALRSTR
ncbi:VOC family protein [Microbacterium soli]|uniref:VOC domain-containing protein n=1 Tax=Microbacterium soli TaxID=446075 RepID=A0ABP7MVJ8_9MICO